MKMPEMLIKNLDHYQKSKDTPLEDGVIKFFVGCLIFEKHYHGSTPEDYDGAVNFWLDWWFGRKDDFILNKSIIAHIRDCLSVKIVAYNSFKKCLKKDFCRAIREISGRDLEKISIDSFQFGCFFQYALRSLIWISEEGYGLYNENKLSKLKKSLDQALGEVKKFEEKY